MCTQHPIAVHKSTFDGIFLGSHVAFLKGARQLHSSRSTWNLVWELPRVLKPVRTLLEPAQHARLEMGVSENDLFASDHCSSFSSDKLTLHALTAR